MLEDYLSYYDIVADTRINGSIAINLWDCMYSNPRDVILENAPNVLAEI